MFSIDNRGHSPGLVVGKGATDNKAFFAGMNQNLNYCY
jgi:hypothetical protein